MTRGRARPRAWLGLEDGTVFAGFAFGAERDAGGEVVFNTSLTGYQEVLTDPSYKGQLVVMTAPHIGNYGVAPEDGESDGIHVEGFIVREACMTPSNWRSTETLPAWLARNGKTGLDGIDTRALVGLLRRKGAMRGVIVVSERKPSAIVERARAVQPIEERDLVQEVCCREAYEWTEPVRDPVPGNGDPTRRDGQLQLDLAARLPHDPHHVVVVDCGVKRNILRLLVSQGCRVTVVPAFSTAEEILARRPDGVVFSNGPGDPDRLPRIVATVRGVIGRVPVLGICLGHQVIGKALGGRTFKLKFGHHGGNHPVLDTSTGRVLITVQNHNFAVDGDTIASEAEVTHINLNDRTVEGLRHRTLPVQGIQFHPEGAPGPHDAIRHFREFARVMSRAKA